MKKILKIFGVLVVVMIVLVVAAVIVLPMVFDPNDHKDEIAARVKEQTGRELRIAGDLKLSVFPWLGIDMGPVELGNAPGFSAPVFAKTEKTQVKVKLQPLLDRRLEMDTVVIHGLTVNLEKDAKGKGNWSDLAKGGGVDAGKTSGPSEGGPGLAALAIGGLDIQDANLNWTDAQTKQSASVNNLSIKTGPVTLGQPVDLEVAFDLRESGGTSGHIEISTRLSPDIENKIFGASDLNLTAKLTGDKLPGGKQTLTVAANVVADLVKQTLSVNGLTISGMGLNASGELAATQIQSAPKFSGKLGVQSFNARELLASLGQSVPETADPAALTKVAANLGLSGTADSLSVNPLAITLDDSQLTGDLGVSNFAKPALRFNLQIDRIDADRYLPPSASGDAVAASPGAAAPAAGELPMEQLRALDINGKAGIGSLTIKKLNLSDVGVTVTAKGGLIQLNPISAKLYDGSYGGNVALDARGSVLKVQVNEKLSGVQVGSLLKDMQGEAPIDGTANMSIAASTSGTQPDAIKKSLNGDVKFAFTNGAINGINIPAMIRKAKAALTGGAGTADSAEVQKTDFSELTGSVKITNGKAHNPDLLAKSPFLRIEGKGDADLVADSVDYGIKTTLVATTKGQGGDELQDLVGVPIPIRVTGNLQSPEFGLDTEALLKSQAAAQLEKQKGKVMEKAKEKLGDKLGGVLGGALGGATGGGSSGGTESGGAAPAGGDAAEKAGTLLKGLFN